MNAFSVQSDVVVCSFVFCGGRVIYHMMCVIVPMYMVISTHIITHINIW